MGLRGRGDASQKQALAAQDAESKDDAEQAGDAEPAVHTETRAAGRATLPRTRAVACIQCRAARRRRDAAAERRRAAAAAARDAACTGDARHAAATFAQSTQLPRSGNPTKKAALAPSNAVASTPTRARARARAHATAQTSHSTKAAASDPSGATPVARHIR